MSAEIIDSTFKSSGEVNFKPNNDVIKEGMKSPSLISNDEFFDADDGGERLF